jgi:glycosyltransferase involved in cell wall biosynthesis
MMTCSVTWLLPVKNGMPFLTETLASIEAQTCKDFTVLAWNDNSTDGTLEELKAWIPNRLPGRIISQQGNGLGTMLARMVEESRTEYCARIDADDINEPHRLERQLAVMRCDPGLGALGSQVTRIDENGREHGQHYQLPLAFDDILHRMLHLWVMWHPTAVFRRHLVLKSGNYKNIAPVEDYDLWMRLVRVTRLQNLDECLLKYRVMDSTASGRAIKGGALVPAMNQCFADNSLETFGLREVVALRLRQRLQKRAILALLPALRYLCRNHGGTLLQRLKTESFREALAALSAPDDRLSRLFLAAFAPGLRAKARGVKRCFVQSLE